MFSSIQTWACLAFITLATTLLTTGAIAQQSTNGGHRFGLAEPRPKTDDTVRLATYNVLNLFDQVDDPSLEGEHDDMKLATSDRRCRNLAEAIKALDADVIALQEVESKAALRWFRDTYLPDMGYRFIASKDVGYYRGIECSILSRHEILDVRVWPNAPLDDVERKGIGWDDVPGGEQLTFQRSPICVRVKINDDYQLTIFSVHHKAGRDYDFQREAEALKIVEYLNTMRKRNPSVNIVVMGDFNCAPWDKSMRVYLKAGMIDTLAHRIVFNRAEESKHYKTHESNRVLDYILLNSAAHRELVIGSPFVFGSYTPPKSYNWREDPYPPQYASDHYPVVVDIRPRDVK